MAHITTIESLRRAIPPAHEMTHLKVGDQLDAQALAFLARAPFFVMATHGPDGTTEASPKGDEPGFVVAENSRTLLIPERPGNGLAFGLQNILSNGDIGLLFASRAKRRCTTTPISSRAWARGESRPASSSASR